jgi:hypothetical protein
MMMLPMMLMVVASITSIIIIIIIITVIVLGMRIDSILAIDVQRQELAIAEELLRREHGEAQGSPIFFLAIAGAAMAAVAPPRYVELELLRSAAVLAVRRRPRLRIRRRNPNPPTTGALHHEILRERDPRARPSLADDAAAAIQRPIDTIITILLLLLVLLIDPLRCRLV